MAIGNGMSFIFDSSKGETPQSVARKRALAAAIMGQMGNRSAKNSGEGIGNALASIGNGISVNVLNRRADKAETAGQESANPIWDALTARMGGGGQEFPAAPSGGPAASAGGGNNYRDAIASIESAGSGDYSAVGPTNSKLGRALGRYQIMEANIGPWSKEALGREVTPQEFMANPQLQDAIFDHQFGKYVNKFGPEGAAQAWFGGEGGVGQTGRKDVLGTTVGAYGNKFVQAMGGQPAVAANEAVATGQPVPQAPVQVASNDPSIGMVTPATQPEDGGFQVGGPAATSQAGNRVLSTMTNPQPMGGAPMPMQGMPQQTAQAAPPGPDLSKLPVMAGGTAGAIQPGQQNMGGPSIQQLIQAASNPWLNDSQKQVVGLLLKQKLAAQDPGNQLDMRYKQAQIDRLTSGAPNANSSFGNLDAQARAAGLTPGTPEYQNFMLNGGGQPATFRALDLQAKAAGFQPGTQEYNEFMATRGAGLQAGAAQNAKNTADINTGGDAERAKAAGKAEGKGQGEALVAYRSMMSKMAGLEKVVTELNGLADQATYTKAGQWFDSARAQAGMEPREAAIARTKYISMVDNQILPLLRDTFGAQFTVQEGEALRATLGDPNKTPPEKKQVLEAFIEQKRRDVEALALQSVGAGEQPAAAPTAAPETGGVVDYRDYFGGQ